MSLERNNYVNNTCNNYKEIKSVPTIKEIYLKSKRKQFNTSFNNEDKGKYKVPIINFLFVRCSLTFINNCHDNSIK